MVNLRQECHKPYRKLASLTTGCDSSRSVCFPSILILVLVLIEVQVVVIVVVVLAKVTVLHMIPHPMHRQRYHVPF